MRRALPLLFLLLLAATPIHPAERPVSPRPIDGEALSWAPEGRQALTVPAPACYQGNLNALAYAVGDWFIGSEEYATVFTASNTTCGCSGGFTVSAVHFYTQLVADDVPNTFNVSVGLYPLVFDSDVGCPVPAPIGCDSSPFEVVIPTEGIYDISIPLSADCGCFTFDAAYALVVRFLDAVSPSIDAVTDDIPLGCTSFNDWGGGWTDLVNDVGFPGELSVYADVSCCDGTICSTPILKIPDFPATGVSDSIVLPGPVVDRLDVDLLIDAEHTLVGDLVFELEHVDTGTSVIPFDRPGVPADSDGCVGNDIDVRLNDEGTGGDVETTCLAATPTISGDLVAGDPPDTTLFRPFEDEDPAGTWTLTVTDSVGSDTGTLNAWCLDLSSTLVFEHDFEGGDVCPWSYLPGAVHTCLACGNSVVEAGESCDDGNLAADDGCGPTCQLEVCGDGILQAGEWCDDGNAVDNDGCSATCYIDSCLGYCGGPTPDSYCYCDDLCIGIGDCCYDACAVCGHCI